MKKILIASILLALLSVSCNRNQNNNDHSGFKKYLAYQTLLSANSSSSSTDVGNAINSSTSATSSAMSSLSDGSNAVSFNGKNPSDITWDEKLMSAIDSIPNLFFSSLEAVTISNQSCGAQGTYSRTASPGDFGAATSFLATWTFATCQWKLTFRGVSYTPNFTTNGTLENSWSGLSTTSPYLQAGAILNVAPNITINSLERNISVTETGNGSQTSGGSNNVAHTFTWSSYSGTYSSGNINSSFTLSTNMNRVAKSGTSTIFSHTITTPTALSITMNQSNSSRTFVSGSHSVKHNLANFTVTQTYSNMVWDYKTCQPVSGSATITVTGSRNGSGTLTITSNGVGTYSYTATTKSGSDVNESGTITFPGCNMN